MRKKLLIVLSSVVILMGVFAFFWNINPKETNYSSLDIPELIVLSNKGDEEAQFSLALNYQEGVKVKQDYNESLKWYIKSAENGNTSSMINLAYLYSYGIGVKQDLDESFNWNMKAAKSGDSSGMFNVSRSFEFGLGVKKDIEKADYWLESSGREL